MSGNTLQPLRVTTMLLTQVRLAMTHYLIHPTDVCAMLDITGTSSVQYIQGSPEQAVPRAYPAKGEWYIEIPQKPK